MSWKEHRIDDLGIINRGKSKHRPRNDSRLFGGEYPFIQTADVKHANLYITDYSSTYSEFGLAQSKMWEKGTLCITIAANIAESAILGFDACFPDSVVGFLPYEGKSDLKFVKYLLDEFKVYMQQISQGTTQDNLSLEKLRRVKFRAPDYETQKRIASILSAYDDLLENNNKRIKILEKMTESIYKEWFVRFRFPGHEQKEFENGFPKEWSVARLSEFGITLDSGSRPKGGIDNDLKEGIPSLGAEAIQDIAQFDYSSVKYIPHDYYDKMKRGKFDSNAIFLYKDGAYIGKTTIFRNKFPFEKFAVNEHVFILKSANSNYQNYLYLTLHQGEYFNLMQNLNRNAAQPGLSQTDIARIKIDVPSEAIVKMFNKIVDPMYEEIFELAKKNRNLTRQRDLLLPRLMSGKLDIR